MALTEQKITALYERLSRDDENMGDSNSIANQKIYLQAQADKRGYTNVVHYTDDGWSGGNFERPGWKKLIADIEAGKVAHVIVKDMSRVGRDYLQTGFYTEVFFRQHGVHFIAVANNVDSDDQSTSEFAPFLNIMNEWYLRDCSRKQLTAYQVRGKAGIPTTNDPIYGYKKDPEDKHHWLIDEEAAEVVRKIFQLAVNGNGPTEIAKILRDSKIERPGSYLAHQGRGSWRNRNDESRRYDWHSSTIIEILSKPEYMGHTVNFRTRKVSYKDKKGIVLPPEEQLVFENTHEAIIDKETWEMAQRTRKVVHRTDTVGEANPLTGLVFCADCGAKMYNHRSYPRTSTDDGDEAGAVSFRFDRYECSTYNNDRHRVENGCCSHYISTSTLRSLVLDAIRTTSRYAITNKEDFAQRVREASELRQKDAAKDVKRRVTKAQRRVAELDTLIKRLYESYALDKISEERFEMLLAEYEREQAELKEAISADEADLDDFNADTDRIEQFMELAKKYTDFTTLTSPMIYEFVDKILVHAPYKDDCGERCQEIEIYLKYIGKLDIPAEPEILTPEELAAEEKKRKQRAYMREYNRRRYAEKKAAAQAAAAKDVPNQNSFPDEQTA